MAKRYVVRVRTQEVSDSMLECFRYAGIATPREDSLCGWVTFDIHCPKGLKSDVWAEQNAARMKSFGYHASKEVFER
jgi:hypothetical protein